MNFEQHILSEDNHLLIVRKPAGILVQADKTGDDCLLDYGKAYLKKKYQKPGNVFLHAVHRLDRPVSGLVVLAKTSKSLERMNAVFQQRQVQKIYLACVANQPSKQEDTLVHWLKKNAEKNKVTLYTKETADALRCELRYQLTRASKNSLLTIFPLTGRSHQIRAQLSFIGCPIIGDVKYGFPEPLPNQAILLHAHQLHFQHPVLKTAIDIEVPTPDYWANYMA